MPVQLIAQRVGLPRALGAILVAWGVIAMSFAGEYHRSGRISPCARLTRHGGPLVHQHHMHGGTQTHNCRSECRRSARRPYALLVGLGACVYPAAAWAQCRGAGLTARAGHLYALRFLLGAAEAGAFPCMWAYLTRFYAGGPDLALAWSFIAAAQPLAQVRAHWVVHRQGIG